MQGSLGLQCLCFRKSTGRISSGTGKSKSVFLCGNRIHKRRHGSKYCRPAVRNSGTEVRFESKRQGFQILGEDFVGISQTIIVDDFTNS